MFVGKFTHLGWAIGAPTALGCAATGAGVDGGGAALAAGAGAGAGFEAIGL